MSDRYTKSQRKIAMEAEGLAGALEAAAILATLPKDPHAEMHRDQLLKAMGWQCVAAGCQRQSRAMGFCDTHYRAFRNIVKEKSA